MSLREFEPYIKKTHARGGERKERSHAHLLDD